MVAMSAVAVLGVIALVAAVVAWVTWHRGADERQSVQHHQHTLETLRHVSDRRQPTVWPSTGRRSAAAKGGVAPRPPPASERSPTSRRPKTSSPPAGVSAKKDAARRETMAFAVADPVARTTRSPTTSASANGDSSHAASVSGRVGRRRAGTAADARRHGHDRVRRTRLVAAATVVVVAGAVTAVLSTTDGTPRGSSHGPRPATAAGHGHLATPQPSTVPGPAAPTAYTATYSAPSSPYTVVVGASASCWVMATQAPTGKVVWTGTVAAGQSQSLVVSGTLVVRLGAPGDASVTIDGKPVQLPAGYRSPFDLTFRAT
jgi:hypothetical protein